jgi:hypothetical protein
MGVRLRPAPAMLAAVSQGRRYGYRIIQETGLPGVPHRSMTAPLRD